MPFPPPAVIAELVRLPAVLSVPGDALSGAVWSGWPRGGLLAASSAQLYLAGMALNDWADREVDAVERPHRPIPSGRVAPSFALGLATALTAGGLATAAAVGGRRALGVAGALAGAVWAYDLGAKHTPAGPLVMASCRALDVLLGAAGGDVRAALPAAAAVGAHTVVVTAVSRQEAEGGGSGVPMVATLATAALSAGVGAASVRANVGGRSGAALAGATAAAGYGAFVGSGYLAAAVTPDAANVQKAVGKGVLGAMALQASLLAARGAHLRALVVGSGLPVARALARRRSVT